MQIGTLPGRVGRRLVRVLDARLRHAQGTFVFSEDERCILRASLMPAERPMRFAGGETVAPGDPLIIIHFWNERLPMVPAAGPDLSWARRMHAQSVVSLRLLASYLESHPELAEVRAIGSDMAGFLTSPAVDTGAVFPRFGFEIERPHASAGPFGRFVEFWENVYSYMLVWTYNPATVRGKAPWALERFGLWMPRAPFLARYGGSPAAKTLSEKS